MNVTYDPSKRARVLEERQLDIADAGQVFENFHLTRRDDQHSDVEERFVSIGTLGEEIVLVVWTPREDERRVVTMWKTNERERQAYCEQRDRSG